MIDEQQLLRTIEALVQPGKGILAADESLPTISKRLKAVGVESTEEARRAYRSLLLGTAGIGDYLSGVILFEETLGQRSDDGTPLPELLQRQGIVPGIKVDKGTADLAQAPGDKITRGLDWLEDRLAGYREQGARFTKWRDVYRIGPDNPSRLAIEANAEVLARYAAVAQEQGFVPIVEPEVLLDGDHDIQRCAEVTEAVLQAVFEALHRHRILLEGMLLKPNMVLPGKDSGQQASPQQVAEATLRVFRRVVPAAVPSINFLSGGQTPEQATANLDAMSRLRDRTHPWELSFSYARALQHPAMDIWAGRPENAAAAQRAFLKRCRLTAAARRGEYRPEMENEAD
ncbi:fructose-bisphosphate aldolase class I [Thiohalobacter sp. IOR34]|uniref:class I fructose-bisphosphate aldolase n=1 Tax=Thiohalobacter sp. IOR34 TaxID=3057176 RepID=UPI0025AEF66C|nr:class I fructose-bisphosphate aldolase [Thiohalobacter sp. IOR34]WJW76341.1 fructose-bisphosphate aldolase class I [Thiohalobacter sp. IOR34]